MRPKSMILILVALACGLVASVGISQMMDRNQGGGQQAVVETQDILVVGDKPLKAGDLIKEPMLKMKAWPKDLIPEGAITDLKEAKEVVGRRPRHQLAVNEPVLKTKLIGGNEQTISENLPDGFSAVSVKVTQESSVSYLMKPGDRVDVLVYLRKGGDILETVTQTILKQVRVLAVDDKIEADENGKTVQAKAVSLMLTPADARKLTLASELGKIRFVLRKPGDKSTDEDDKGAKISDIIKSGNKELADENAVATAEPQPPAPDTSKTKFTDFLNAQGSKPASDPVAAPVDAAPRFTMDILGPEGVRRFAFHKEGELPVEVTGGSAPASTDPPAATHAPDQPAASAPAAPVPPPTIAPTPKAEPASDD